MQMLSAQHTDVLRREMKGLAKVIDLKGIDVCTNSLHSTSYIGQNQTLYHLSLSGP